MKCRRACFGSALNLNPHLHMLFLDGAYAFRGRRAVFHRACRPTGDELTRLLDSLSRRIVGVLERREGWSVGKNQVYRLYCEESLQLRSKLPRRRRMVVTRRERYVPQRPGQAWTMDFVADQLVNGQRFRILAVVDVYTREALAVEPAHRMGAEGVVAVCNRLAARIGAPRRVFVDNGSEFSGRLLDLWAYHHGVRIDFSRPGKPTDNCFVETFNGSLRDECLNVHWFETLEDAKERIEAWRQDYNVSRPHQALKEMTPAAFAHQARLSGEEQVQ